jgi:hypothetical protein
MAEEKKTSQKKGTKSTSKKTSSTKPASKTQAKQRSTTKKQSNVKPTNDKKIIDKPKDKSFLVDAAENIDAGTKLVKEKTAELASDIAKKAAGFKDTLFDKVIKGVSEAYEAGSKAIEELTETAQDYAEKYKHKIEINKLKLKQDKQYTSLGSLIFDKYKVTGITADKLFEEEDIKLLINEIENIAEQIVKQGKALDKIGKASKK